MCGFVFARSSVPFDKKDQIWPSIVHRGPDFQGEESFYLDEKYFSFWHARLAINDLTDAANQPFVDDHGILLFNGEVYNFRELRAMHPGYEFRTSGDTEVVAAMIKIYGIKKACELFRGMYAIIYLSLEDKKVSMARDDYGIKPLYYSVDEGQLIASSSLDSIRSLKSGTKVSINSISKFFNHRYIFPPSTIYEHVFSLEPGHVLVFEDDNSFRKERINTNITTKPIDDLGNAVDRLDELLNLSISEQVNCDVPIAISVSGGLDSSLLAAICYSQGVDFHAFSYKHSNNDIDWYYAQTFYRHFPDIEKTIVPGPVSTSQYKIFLERFDQPISDSSSFPILKLAEAISKNYKVVLCGDGADELFGGYSWHGQFLNYKRPMASIFGPISIRQKLRTIRDVMVNARLSDAEVYKRMVLNRFSSSEIHSMGLPDTMFDGYLDSEIVYLNDILAIDRRTFMQMTLSRTDLATMAYSVEARVPYLDKRIVDFASSLPEKFLINEGVQKLILQKVAERYLPDELINRPKRGFGTDLQRMLNQGDPKQQAKDIINTWLDFRDLKFQ